MSEKAPKPRRDEYTEATQQALLEAGREAFVRDGFQSAGIEAISRAARVTRGAFYHHFEDKKALFDAVVVELQADAARRIEAQSRREADVWRRLFVGMNAFLDICLEPAYARIVVHEGPVVLGYARFREIEEAYPMALLAATLAALQRRGELACDDVDLLCRMVDAMICKLAIILPHTPDPQGVRRRGQAMISKLLETYRRPSA